MVLDDDLDFGGVVHGVLLVEDTVGMKAATKARKRRGVTCSIRGCTTRVVVQDLCMKHVSEELDDWFRTRILNRDEHCVRCLAVSSLQVSHHITRGAHPVRWDPLNAVIHCAGCHVYFTNNPALHVEWIRDYLGEVTYGKLLDMAYGPISEYTGRREGGVKPDYEALLEQARAS